MARYQTIPVQVEAMQVAETTKGNEAVVEWLLGIGVPATFRDSSTLGPFLGVTTRPGEVMKPAPGAWIIVTERAGGHLIDFCVDWQFKTRYEAVDD